MKDQKNKTSKEKQTPETPIQKQPDILTPGVKTAEVPNSSLVAAQNNTPENTPAKPKSKSCCLPVLIVFILMPLLFFIAYKIYRNYDYRRTYSDVKLIQTNLADATFAKFIGDEIANQHAVPEGWNMPAVLDNQGTNYRFMQVLSFSPLLDNYKESVSTWINSMAGSDGTTASWKTIPETPAGFAIELDDHELQQAFSDALSRIVELKEYGDLSIYVQDRYSMGYIAAHLLVQIHWLDNLENATAPNFFELSFADGKLVGSVFATGPLNPPKRTPCLAGGKLCYSEVKQSLNNVYRSALGYSVSTPDAQATWSSNWNTLEPIINSNGIPIETGGVTIGEANGYKVSPSVKNFMDECGAKGGTVNGEGGVKEYLPTTESGYTCWYKQSGKCWDLLTYSGGRYKGGNPGCPEDNLMPRPAPNIFNNVADFFKGIFEPSGTPDNGTDDGYFSYDGTYTLEYTGGSCNIPGFDAYNFSPFTYNITVQNNQVLLGQEYATIDANGNAQIDYNFSASGIWVRYLDTMVFSKDGTVRGSYSANAGGSSDGYGVSVECTGEYSGYK